MRSAAALAAALVPLVAGGAVGPHPGAPFDGRYAYGVTKLQLSFGPRPAGSPAERAAAARLVRLLPGGRYEPVPGGLRNIVGALPGRLPAIVVAAHYDTTAVPGYLGANNSAAGVGAVVAIARALRDDPRVPGEAAVRFVLFDGEEAPPGFSDFYSEGLRGSRAYAARHAAEVREVIVLDFIALHDEQLARDASSSPALWARLRAAAARVGALALFPDAIQSTVLDDHTPFLRASIPAIDLIDFSYPCWQKRCDDLAQVSQRNLTLVGRAVLELVRSERLRGVPPPRSAARPGGVTPSSIAGIRLGTSRDRVRTLLVPPVRLDRLEGGYERLVSGRERVEAYFRSGSAGVVAVTTWSRAQRTAQGIGPCSTVAALKAAYGRRLAPIRRGTMALAYRLGDLVFRVGADGRVDNVALGRASATFLALNAYGAGCS